MIIRKTVTRSRDFFAGLAWIPFRSAYTVCLVPVYAGVAGRDPDASPGNMPSYQVRGSAVCLASTIGKKNGFGEARFSERSRLQACLESNWQKSGLGMPS